MTKPRSPLSPERPASHDREPGGSADNAGATSMAEKVARQSANLTAGEKARLGAEASRDEDA